MDTPGRPPRRPGPGPERLRRAIRLPGVDPPDSAGRDKPPCCDESTDLPPVLGAAVAELVERAQKYAGQGASQHSDGNAAPVSPARRCTPSRRPERQDLPALPRSLPALPSCTSTRHRIRASEISRSVTSPREPDTLHPPLRAAEGRSPGVVRGARDRTICAVAAMRDSLRLVAAPVAGRARRSGPDDVVEEVLDGGDDLAQDGGGQGQRARQDYCCGCGTHTAIDQRSKLCPSCYMRWPCQPVMGAGRPGASTAGGRPGREALVELPRVRLPQRQPRPCPDAGRPGMPRARARNSRSRV